MSLIIANRFKNYEKLYDVKPDEYKLNNSINKYYYDKEIEENNNCLNKTIHFLFLVIWIPAIISIGYVGWEIEKNSSDKNKSLNEKITQIDSMILIKNDVDKFKCENIILIDSNKNYLKKIDSLKSIIKIINKENEILRKK